MGLTKRATIYLQADVHRAVRIKAAETETSVSDLVNAAVRRSLAEDADDLAAFRARAKEPTLNFETVVNLIGGTRTQAGLRVKAVLDTHVYETGTKVTAKELKTIRLRRHKFHPDWNYTLHPKN